MSLQKAIFDAVQIAINEKTKNLQFDYTIRGKIIAVHTDQTSCTVDIFGQPYICTVRNGIVVANNDVVLVKIAANNFDDRIIDGKVGSLATGGSGEGGAYTSADFDHSGLRGTHNLTTDIDHNQLKNYKENEHLTTYIHHQILPLNQWSIVHNLEKYPSVTVVDSGGNTVIGDVIYVNNNLILINFLGGSFSGRAYLN